MGDGAYYDALARWIADLAGVEPLLETPAGVEVAERWQGGRQLRFVLNHTPQLQTLDLKTSYTNLLDDQTLAGEIRLEPFGVLILTS
jgi:beta-galactosidase